MANLTGEQTDLVGSVVAKKFRDGTHRAVEPQVTIDRVTAKFTELGITRVANLAGLDPLGLPVVAVTRPNSKSISVHLGKGTTLATAKASALMEAVEAFHAEEIIQPLTFSSHDDFNRKRRVIDCSTLPRTQSSKYHSSLRILWIEALDLVSGESFWVPYELVSGDYTLPAPPGSGCFHATSNGLGAGNVWSEAVIHAVCELIERDARTIWHIRGGSAQQERRIRPESIDDVACVSLLESLAPKGFFVAIWDITTDLLIPCFLVGLRGPDGFHGPDRRWFVGSGAHPCRGVALCRAITEAAQSRLTYISGARDDLDLSLYVLDSSDKSQNHDDGIVSWKPERDYSHLPDYPSESLDDDVHMLKERILAAGLEKILVVDLTREEVGIPVVRILVPGLESMHSVPGFSIGQRGQRLLRQ